MIQAVYQSIESLMKDIEEGKLLLPEMQRGYVWKSTQVRDLFDSLYHEYPSGQLLVWETDDLPSGNRQMGVGSSTLAQRSPRLLLDGQQRLTSLAAVMLKRALIVRDTTKEIDIAFNVINEKFEVAGPRHTIQNNWISLVTFFTEGAMSSFIALGLDPKTPEAKTALEHLNRLEGIKKYQYHVNVLVHLNYDEVTRIFVRTNSGGTNLGNADLALAQISSRWSGITRRFSEYQTDFGKRSWGLKLDNGLLLRAIVVLLTGQTRFSRMFKGDGQNKTVAEIEDAWERAKVALDTSVSFLVHNCLIDHLEMLPTRSILMPLIAFFDRYGEQMTTIQTRELQRWVYMALIWTRYSSSSETAMDQDIAALSKENPIQAMIQNIENEVGRRPITEQELQDQRKNSPSMVMAYVLARQAKAQDWFSGIGIGNGLTQQEYHLHHIFPKSRLGDTYSTRKDSWIVDQVANLVFLAGPISKSAANRLPDSYLPEIDEQRLRAQYVPLQPELWKINKFLEFVLQRRIMLANAINQLFQSLSEDKHIWTSSTTEILEARVDTLEKKLRKLVSNRLSEARGESAWDHLVPPDIRGQVLQRIKKQEKNKPFTAGQYETLENKLEFCLFSDLFKIVQANWELFKDIFGNTTPFTSYGQFVTNVRNDFKHGKQVLDVDLASAEAGLLWFEQCLRHFDAEAESSDDALSAAI